MQRNGTDPSLRLPNYVSDQESGTSNPPIQQQRQHEQTLINPSLGCHPLIRTPQPVLTPPNYLCFCPRCLNERRARRVLDGGYSHQLARLGSSDGGSSSSGQSPRLTYDRVAISRYNQAPFIIPDARGQSQPRFSDTQTLSQRFQNLAVSTDPAVPGAHNHSRPTLPLSMSNRPPLELSRSQQLIDGFYAAAEALLVLLVEMGVPNPMLVACDGVSQIWQEIQDQHNMNFPSPGQPPRGQR